MRLRWDISDAPFFLIITLFRGDSIMAVSDDMLSNYEKAKLEAINTWKNKEPGIINKGFGLVIEPAAFLIRKMVPIKAIEGALTLTTKGAEFTLRKKDILKRSGVSCIPDLHKVQLETCDKLSDIEAKWGIGLAAAEGTATGSFGLFGIPVDIPASLTIAIRTIYHIGYCYGFECESLKERQFIYGILAASGANSMEEKIAALALLKSIERTIATQTWKKMTLIAAEKQLSKEGVIIAVRNLSKQLGINMTKRAALKSIPVISALIGGGVNAWYLNDVATAAVSAFSERWLIQNGKIGDNALD